MADGDRPDGDRPDGDRTRSAAARALDVVVRLTGRGGRRSQRTERVLLVVAVVVFVGSAVVAWQQLPEGGTELDWRWVAVVAALGAVALGLNAREFAWSARVLGAPVDAREALRVSTLSSAANVLPIPGSVAIRTRALLQGGQRLSVAAVVTTAVGVVWVAVAGLAAAVLLVTLGEGRLALLCGVGGAAFLVGAALVLRRQAPATTGTDLARLVLLEATSAFTSGTRLWAVGLALGFDVSYGQAMTVNLGGILSNVAGFLPGGLGLRELASGAFGALVGVPAAAGVLLAVGDRLVFYVVLTVVTLWLLRGRSGGLRAELAAADGADAGVDGASAP